LALSLAGALSVTPLIGLLLIFVLLSYFLIINSKQNFINLLKYLPFSIIIFILTEWPKLLFAFRAIFLLKSNPLNLLSLSYDSFDIKAASILMPLKFNFGLLRILFTGEWMSVFTNNLETLYTFPIIIIFFSLTSFISLYYILKNRKRKREIKLFLLYLWLFIFLFAMSFNKYIFFWYLTEILPLLYILGMYTIYIFLKQLNCRL